MWYQLKIEDCPVTDVEQLNTKLEELEVLSITLTDKNDNPILEPDLDTTPLWPEVIIQALFTQAEQAEYARMQLTQLYPLLKITLETLEDQAWERVWMADFKPQCFGKRLWICPTWATPPEPEAINLMLDPGLAFGTGSHETTSLCLNWLDGAPLQGLSVIDYGCGSGILALAALKLGAAQVQAVDIDPQALQATHNNAQTNNLLTERLTISMPDDITASVNLIIANILLPPLLALQKRFIQLLHPQGILAVSGILTEQTPTLITTYEKEFLLLDQKQQNGWSLLIFKRK